MMKLCGTELSLAVAQYAMELLGLTASSSTTRRLYSIAANGRCGCCAARGPTIYAGTNQIQHNIVGKRVLGLPKG